jgi:type VI secretion system protein ImpM
MSAAGVYGKLPAHGDFIQRNLSPAFVRQWDPWLQHFVAGAKEKMGADWLDIYLTSPIWRFVLSQGVIDEGRWAGILMPSVDQVGRYFPFTIAVRLPENQNPLEFMSLQTSWFSAIEELGLRALNGEIELDDLAQELEGVPPGLESAYEPAGVPTETYAMQVDMELEEQSAASAYPCMLDAMLSKLLGSYSIWSTTGSERVASCVFNVQGLPTADKLPAMLDGLWRQWGWVQPYTLKSGSAE